MVVFLLFPGVSFIRGSTVLYITILSTCRILEINDTDVTTFSPRETTELLQKHYQQGGVKIAVARLLSDAADTEDGQEHVLERYKKLNSSLSVRLDSQNAETEHWRQECNRYSTG